VTIDAAVDEIATTSTPATPSPGGSPAPGAAEFEVQSSCEPLAAEWDALAVEAGALPFMRPGFVERYWDAFGGGELEVWAMRQDGELRAVLPMARRGAILAAPTNWHTPDFDLVARDEPSGRALISHMIASEPRRLEFRFVEAGGGIGTAIHSLAGGKEHSRVLERSPYIVLDGNWEDFQEALPTKLRRDVRRGRRKLEEQGKLEFEMHDGRENLDVLLDEGFQIEASGWKGEMGTSINSQPETERFYRAVAEWAAKAGLLRLAMLRVDGRVVAFEYAIQDDRAYYLLKPGYDDSLKKLGPGNILLFETIAHSFSDGLETFEFGGMDDPHKLRYTSLVRERLELQLFSGGASGLLDRLIQTRAKSAARSLRQRLRR
jgi:CelD/BcsL family acetyltransferase involved in cellulose biosynthesis